MTQTLIEQLKECPFCGGEVVFDYNNSADYGLDQPGVECSKCAVRNFAPTKDDAIEAWNKRAIIEQSETEGAEPLAYLCVWKPTGASFPTKLKADMEHFKAHGYEITPLFSHPSPDIVAELVKALDRLTVGHQRVKEIMMQEAGIGLIDQTALAEAVDVLARAKGMMG